MCEPVNAGVDPHDFGLLLEWKWSHDGALDRWHRRRPGAHAAEAIDDFEQAMSDQANVGMSKSVFAAMGVDDPTALDPDDL